MSLSRQRLKDSGAHPTLMNIIPRRGQSTQTFFWHAPKRQKRRRRSTGTLPQSVQDSPDHHPQVSAASEGSRHTRLQRLSASVDHGASAHGDPFTRTRQQEESAVTLLSVGSNTGHILRQLSAWLCRRRTSAYRTATYAHHNGSEIAHMTVPLKANKSTSVPSVTTVLKNTENLVPLLFRTTAGNSVAL